jgi:hypothetical protein
MNKMIGDMEDVNSLSEDGDDEELKQNCDIDSVSSKSISES